MKTHVFLFPDSHKCICESGLGGRRHVEMGQIWMGCKSCRPETYLTYVGGSQGEADRQRCAFPDMPLTLQGNKNQIKLAIARKSERINKEDIQFIKTKKELHNDSC